MQITVFLTLLGTSSANDFLIIQNRERTIHLAADKIRFDSMQKDVTTTTTTATAERNWRRDTAATGAARERRESAKRRIAGRYRERPWRAGGRPRRALMQLAHRCLTDGRVIVSYEPWRLCGRTYGYG